MDALLSDICISTSAAPTYLPAHFFRTEDCHGNIKEFNLIDGGVAANNPVRCLCSCEQLITIEVHSVMLKMVWQVYPVHILKRCFFPKRPWICLSCLGFSCHWRSKQADIQEKSRFLPSKTNGLRPFFGHFTWHGLPKNWREIQCTKF